MAVIPVVYQGIQLGPESSFGVEIDADTRILSLGMSRIQPQAEGGLMFRGQGNKVASAVVPAGKQWSTLSFDGIMDYQALPYVFCSAIETVSAVPNGTNGKEWVFAPSLASAEPRTSYTIEVGNATRAKQVLGGLFHSFTLEMSKSMNRISGNIIAGKRIDDITITASPTTITPFIIAPQDFTVKIAAAKADLTAASEWPLSTKAVFTFPENVDPLFRMFSTDTTFHALVDKALDPITLALTVGDDDSDYGTLLANIDSGATKWIRIKATGDVIAGAMASAYDFQLDFAGALITPETPEEESSAALNTFTFNAVYDATSALPFEIRVVNTLAAL